MRWKGPISQQKSSMAARPHHYELSSPSFFAVTRADKVIARSEGRSTGKALQAELTRQQGKQLILEVSKSRWSSTINRVRDADRYGGTMPWVSAQHRRLALYHRRPAVRMRARAH